MAQNRQSELKPHHSSSSEEEEEEEEVSGSEDEEASGSESEEASDSDSEEKRKQQRKKTLISAPQSTKKPDLSSSETEESGSDTDSDSPPKRSAIVDINIKPISSKPMEREEGANADPKSAKKSRPKTSSTPSPAKTGKRPPPAAAAAGEKDSKKAKKSTAATDDDSKKQLFQRLWSEDDEIVILKGMIDYKTEKKGADPVADMGAFHEFIKKSLHVDVSRAQLVDKVRRLKKKFVNNASKEKNGKDRSFSKSHEQKGYELSKLIWGTNSNTETKKNQNQKNGNPKGNAATTSTAISLPKANGVDVEKEASTMEVDKKMDVARFVQYGRSNPVMEEEIMKAGLELVEGSKRDELEEKWKILKKQEFEVYLKRLELLQEQASIVFEAVNSSRN